MASERILLVDDEAGIRSSLTRVLADEGYQVEAIGTGEKALITRIRYYAVTPDHFLWRADGSSDGGKTWIRDFWKIEANRAK